jgi:hypothetical protein
MANFVGGRHHVRHHHVAIVDAAVASAGDAVIGLQFEIGGSAALPDDEGVALDDRLGRDFAHQRAVLDTPVLGIAFPSGQGFAVENGTESRFVAGGRFGTVGLFWNVLRGHPACFNPRREAFL